MPDLIPMIAPDNETIYIADGAPYRGSEARIVHAQPAHVEALQAHGFRLLHDAPISDSAPDAPDAAPEAEPATPETAPVSKRPATRSKKK